MICSLSLPVLGGIFLLVILVMVLTYRRSHSVGAASFAGVIALIVSGDYAVGSGRHIG
jgi:hypothetical protein